MKKNSLKDLKMLENGFKILRFEGLEHLLELSIKKDWQTLDKTFFNFTKRDSPFYSLLQEHHTFDQLEHIINHRVAENDEDGIWHDDGSRFMAFSVSLNPDIKSIQGGELLLRSKKNPDLIHTLGPFPFGTVALFLTGEYGFEHKVCRVLNGERTVIAGWCS